MIKRIVIMVVGVLILVMALALPACSPDSADEPATEGLGSNQPVEGIATGLTWQEYSGLGQDFSMELPSDWEVQEQRLSYVFVNSPAEDAYLSVVLNRGIGDYTLEDYADLWYRAGAGDTQGYYNYKKISSSDLTIAGSIPAKEFTEEFSFEGEDGARKGTEVFFVSGGTGYRLYAESPLEQYADYEPVFDHIIESFRITGAASPEIVWETYSNEEYGFSAKLPHDWWVEVSAEDEAVYIINIPGYDANGALRITESQGNSLDEMVDASLASFEENYETFEVISDKRISIRGVEARETISVLDAGFGEFKGKGIGLISGELYYRASFVVDPELYEFFEPVWDVVFASFTLQSDANPTLNPPANNNPFGDDGGMT